MNKTQITIFWAIWIIFQRYPRVQYTNIRISSLYKNCFYNIYTADNNFGLSEQNMETDVGLSE